ncbi:MAG: prefoldin subunit alpha [Halobacteria archaeon]|nr:prefoldin subunit alpha [Halobacteria archaeon]
MSMQQQQQLQQAYSELAGEIEELRELVETLEDEIEGCDEAIESLENLEEGSEILLPLGGDTYIPATVDNVDDVVVGIGAGVNIEVGPEEAVEKLETKRDDLQEEKQSAESDIEQKTQEIQQIQQQAQMAQQQQQQQMQQDEE